MVSSHVTYENYVYSHRLSRQEFALLWPTVEIVFHDKTEQDVHDFLAATVDCGATAAGIRALLSEGWPIELVSEHWQALLSVPHEVRMMALPRAADIDEIAKELEAVNKKPHP